MIRSIFTPVITLIIMTPITLLVTGPIGYHLGVYVAEFITGIYSIAGVFGPFILGLLRSPLTVLGLHYSIGPIQVTEIASVGFSVLLPTALCSNIAQAGATMGIAILSKNKEEKVGALSASVTALCGITEPAMFGYTLTAIESKAKVGHKAVIIGGGSIGCELGLELSLEGHDVTIVEMADDIALNGNMLYRIALKQHMDKQDNLHVVTQACCKEIEEDQVIVEINGKEEKIGFDTIINAAGRKALKEEAMSLYGVCKDTVMVGDCERVGSVIDAVNIAYFVGKSL
jgi:hypothetical protein